VPVLASEHVKLATPEDTVTGPEPPGFVHVSEPPLGPDATDNVTAVELSPVTTWPTASSTDTDSATDEPAERLEPAAG